MGKKRGKRPPHDKFLPYSLENLWGRVGGNLPVNEMLCVNYTSGLAPNVNQTWFGVLGSLRWHSAGSRPVLQRLAYKLISKV